MNYIPLFIIIPLVAAFLAALFYKLSKRLNDIVALTATLALAVLSALVLVELKKTGMLTYAVGGWAVPLGITLAVDGLSCFMLVLVNALIFLVTLYSAGYMDRREGKWRYYAVLLLMTAGLNGVLLTTDLFNAFVFTEITVISAYILASFFGDAENFEASLKYTVLGSLSSMLILFAIALIYSGTSSLSFSGIAASFGALNAPLRTFILALLVVGFGLKTTLVPFHAWVPDAYVSAPSPATAVFSGAVSKVAGVYLLVRLIFNVLGADPGVLGIIAALGVVSIVVAVTLALYQWDFKRLLAYHSISQIGYIMLGIGLGTPLGVLGGLFHLINHSAFKSLLFLNAGSIEHVTGTRNIKELGGLAQKLPVTGSTSMIASLAISGVPPLNGFWSKLVIILACISAKQYLYAFLAAGASILTLASFMKVQRYAFYGYLKDSWSTVKEAPLSMTLPMIVLALGCVFLGILLLPGIDWYLGSAVDTLMKGIGTAAPGGITP